MSKLPVIKLIGNPEENFYSLGKKDKDGYILIQDQITKLCMRSEYAAKLIKKVTEVSTIYNKKGSIRLESELKAYAEGLEKPYSEVLFTFLLPEIVASFNKWLPNLLGIVPGCSSLFIWDQKNQSAVHGRILDYALAGPYEEFERAVEYNFSKRLKSFSYSTVAMPFPSLSSMNEKGLTLALHYKHGDYFDITGESIFSLMYQLTSYCTNISEVKKYLLQNPSMAHWGINCSDISGNVASFDIKGSEVYTEKFDLRENKFLYFNNRPLLSQKSDIDLQPYGNKEQCLMRKDFIFNRMKNFNFESSDIQEELLKTLTSVKSKKSKDAKNWKLSPLTPSSIQALTFHSKLNQSYYIPGKAPKFFRNEFVKFSNINDELTFELIKVKSAKKASKKDTYSIGVELIAKAQSSMDKGDTEKAYHELQMSIIYLEGYPEYYISKFYFLVWQYIHESSNKDLSFLYNEFNELKDKLPSYLNDHRILFISRLNKILAFGDDSELRAQIKHPKLLEIYEKEIKMKSVALKMLRRFIVPRIEILDIVYVYA
jgi:hypothetical protein